VAADYSAALSRVAPHLASDEGRDAVTRVAYAEAGNQGDAGLAGVVYTVLNRLIDEGFGWTLVGVLDAPGQFEPVSRAGGRWSLLPRRSAVERAHIDTIINLALDGRLPDPTNGARYFQNPAIVAARAAGGSVSPGLVNFGGRRPIAVIRDHAFYDGAGQQDSRQPAVPPTVFIPVRSVASSDVATAPAAAAVPANPPSLFVPIR
jgi:spore germination cell wall hydrolase CwlJ-like protein